MQISKILQVEFEMSKKVDLRRMYVRNVVMKLTPVEAELLRDILKNVLEMFEKIQDLSRLKQVITELEKAVQELKKHDKWIEKEMCLSATTLKTPS